MLLPARTAACAEAGVRFPPQPGAVRMIGYVCPAVTVFGSKTVKDAVKPSGGVVRYTSYALPARLPEAGIGRG